MPTNIPFTMKTRSSVRDQHKVQVTHKSTTINGRRAVQLFTESINGKGSMTLFLSPRPSPKLRLGQVPRRLFIKAATLPCLLHNNPQAEDDEKPMVWTTSSLTDSEMLDAQTTSSNHLAGKLVVAADDRMDIDPAESDVTMAGIESEALAEVDVKMEDVDDEHVDIEMK
ncbi:hypothetical protein D6D01_04630 [Aureobasidium pullulans]|uniref:Uncharacterized protein n=1 Tax=Aureobasidium pullulans TaxID=5580 RepID=A0A4S9L9S5_AURPU|nr:hypothetical protein D6D01_04630 [Aureobasidium pullulans]